MGTIDNLIQFLNEFSSSCSYSNQMLHNMYLNILWQHLNSENSKNGFLLNFLSIRWSNVSFGTVLLLIILHVWYGPWTNCCQKGHTFIQIISCPNLIGFGHSYWNQFLVYFIKQPFPIRLGQERIWKKLCPLWLQFVHVWTICLYNVCDNPKYKPFMKKSLSTSQWWPVIQIMEGKASIRKPCQSLAE
jgi:hypothetical protein